MQNNQIELTEEDRRILTTLVYGEVIFDGNFFGKTGQGDMREIPSFTTGNDMVLVKDKIVEMGRWEGFYRYAYMIFREMHPKIYIDNPPTHANWLINPTTFCRLAAEWWRTIDNKQ